ncbi:DUF3037 domain-containing protein [Pseudomonas sp. CCI3.2]|uniref:DUF3037 domain-containing protein n=1 Tax=unclassified Pseudomonas TaxID=196821 RepID=UPI002AC8B9FD|nr:MULTISPECIES: DUF3037 domain-containing protein [unclassified Pseudomonas]MEB0079407.1 DUF3037 domain-containing protein [Pseudomonas sp. MH10out]MEB0103761.1 DUF3037 domain-containing protein [Pseudomonas sp. CCI3.2]MEB0132394.1 DUF3037 domain-containing protein [Pseudomonas sp. CCI2.4]MEB0159676.1 DUF3037 domain-containing protein [Pseudomonas sp. AH2 (2023)]MEB0169116.1 DUF3037 domain-containing protein [Pseudomonas sp. CCC4.4]
MRFAPFAETEEFANVGIVLSAPAIGRIEYKLARKNLKRVNHFFECANLFAKAMEIAQNELDAVRLMTADAQEAQIVNHFRYLTEPKESLIRFGPMRSILVENLDVTLEELFARYIERQGIGRDRREEVMVREIRTLFSEASIRSFRDDTLTGDLTKLHLPLVHRNEVVAAIKPLAFDQADPSAILDHCDQWLMKFVRAEREGIIQLKNVLIPVAAPIEGESPRHRKAVQIAKDSIQEHGLQLVDFQASQAIAAFAQNYAK